MDHSSLTFSVQDSPKKGFLIRQIAVPLTAILGIASLISGVFAGFNRLGWIEINTGMGGEHGALMTGSFLGTVILLERVVTSKNRLLLALPIINGLSLPLFFAGQHQASLICLSIGSIGLCYVYLDIISRMKELGFYIMLAGAVCWLIGNMLIIMYQIYPLALPWWICFFLLTIVGERLELTKFLPVKKKMKHLLVVFLAATVISLGFFFHNSGQLIAGLFIIGIVVWLLKYDMVRKNLFREGLYQYAAVMLTVGYLWLGIYGLFLLSGSYLDISYDTLVHTFFIGFVMNMIFAHAPIILPGVAKLKFYPYHPILYISGFLLQVSLILRIYGNVISDYDVKYYSSIFNGIFIFTFFLSMIFLVIKNRFFSNQDLKKK